MGSAQLDILAFEEAPAPASADALKLEVAERLRAHRERRSRGTTAAGHAPSSARKTTHNPLAAAVAESVAARFAQTPSYRAILAEQAQLAAEQASRDAEQAAAQAEQAAAQADIAARNAHAIAEAQQQLLAELELWDAPQQFTPATAEVLTATPEDASQVAEKNQSLVPHPAQPHRVEWVQPKSSQHKPKLSPPTPPPPVKEVAASGLTVRLYEDLGRVTRSLPASTNAHRAEGRQDSDEALALDDEIAFRQSPVFEPFIIEPTVGLPANLLEFPRQLVAARKARPRLAEGPLLEEPAPRNPQLRIFEVEPDQIAATPAPVSASPEWLSIRLGAYTPLSEDLNLGPAERAAGLAADPGRPALAPSMLPPHTAPLSLRLMAATVDAALVAGAFLAFVAIGVHFAQSVPTGIPAAITAGVTLVFFYLLYELLFFTLSDQTPGMRYARIGLCTLSDENPSRAAIRRRILAQIVAACPLGLGLLWALLDDDGLGWHDRISRMYQRAY